MTSSPFDPSDAPPVDPADPAYDPVPEDLAIEPDGDPETDPDIPEEASSSEP